MQRIWQCPSNLVATERTLICDWLRQHDIEPSNVRIGCIMVSTARELHVTLYQRDENGKHIVDWAANQPVTVPYVTPLLAPAPIRSAT